MLINIKKYYFFMALVTYVGVLEFLIGGDTDFRV
jgi:hypothetical protein